MRCAVAVFVIEQQNEIRVPRQVIERALDQFPDRPFRRQSLEVELALLGADFLIHPFQDRQIERVLVAEIMVDQLLVDAGARRDFVDPGAGEPAAREFTPRRRQQLAAGGDRIAPLPLDTIGSSLQPFPTRQLTIRRSLVALVALPTCNDKAIGRKQGELP